MQTHVRGERKMTYSMKIGFAMLTVALAAAAAPAAGVAPRFRWQARLTDTAGVPLAPAPRVLTFGLYRGGSPDAAGSGALVYRETAAVDVAAGGIASHSVGTGVPDSGQPAFGAATLRAAAGSGDTAIDVHLQVAVDTPANVILPRTRLDSVPFALASADGDARTPLSAAATTTTITVPGSYYLTANIAATTAPGADGIVIAAPDVTLDLNGFALRGAPGSGAGVRALPGADRCQVRGGSVSGWGATGVDLSAAVSAAVRGVRAGDNAGAGIHGGSGCVVENCSAEGNGARGSCAGIVVGDAGVVRGCSSTGNFSAAAGVGAMRGIQGGQGATITGCSANGNKASGTGLGAGIQVGNNSTVTDCAATANTGGNTGNGAPGYGILAAAGCVISRNSCCDNKGPVNSAGTGISAGDDNVIENNTCRGNQGGFLANGYGVFAGSRNVIRGNTCAFNRSGTSSGSGYGVAAVNGNLVERNSVSGNSTIVTAGNGFGISLASDNSVVGNLCQANNGSGAGGSFGVSVQSRNRVDGNHCASHALAEAGGFGIRTVTGNAGGNTFVRNTTTGNATGSLLFQNNAGVNISRENIWDEGPPTENFPGINVLGPDTIF